MPKLSFFYFSSFLSKCSSGLFSLLYPLTGTLLLFCSPVCALVSFVLIDLIIGFLFLPGQSIVLYFCCTVLIFNGCMCICGYSVTHFIDAVNFYLYVWLLQFCRFFPIYMSFYFYFFFFLFLFSIIVILFSFIFVSWRLITLQYCSVFAIHWHESAPWFYKYCPSRTPLPPPSPSDSSGTSQCTRPKHLSHASNLGWWSVSP